MAQDIYQGMFGPRPEDMEQLYTQEYVRGPIAGGKDTVEGVIGQMAGRSARNLLGAAGLEDPRMQEAKATQQAIMEVRDSGVNPSDPVEYYKALAKAFSKYGLADKAAMAADKANAAEDKDLDREVKKGVLDAKRQELLARAAAKSKNGGVDIAMLEKLLSGSGATAESQAEAVAAFIRSNGDFEAATSKFRSKDGDKFIGTTTDGNLAVFNGASGQYIYQGGKRVPYEGPIKSASGITNDLRQSSADEQALLHDFKGGRDAQLKRVTSAQQMIPLVQQYKAVLQNPMITGSFSNFRTWFERLAVSSGLEKNPEKLSNSDLFDSVVTKLVLPQMAMVGGNDSNEEMQRILAATGDRKMTPETLKRIVEIMERDIARTMKVEEAYEAHKAAGGRPSDFSFSFGKPIKGVKGDAALFSSGAAKPTAAASKPKYEITSDRIEKYKAYVKNLTGRDLTDEQARQALEASRPKQ